MEMDSNEHHRDIFIDHEEKGHRCEATDNRAMGMAMPWYCKGGSSVRASNFASDESLGHQHMGVVFHQGKSSNASTKKGHRCEATDNRAMGMAMPWYRRGGTSVKVIDPLLSWRESSWS
ncbi:hypothetical protein C4D60_Mb06t20890 [Musa balbisiana]|uniref:Uncharacterized protein n=1 Tax=Musa balbisiana TaxID=52838 RepID=A0A4S8IS19_MUSBA|nr:hypothetical protein C4D60_Mb06t20890 [Musa balbisiana]